MAGYGNKHKQRRSEATYGSKGVQHMATLYTVVCLTVKRDRSQSRARVMHGSVCKREVCGDHAHAVFACGSVGAMHAVIHR